MTEEGHHQLQTAWAFWYDKKQKFRHLQSTEFRDNLHKLGSFDTVESFWKMYVHMKRPSSLDLDVNLYLFRDGSYTPMWECFPNGGCWILKIRKKRDSGASVLGKIWQDLVFAAVGERFDEPDVVGISVSIRKQEDLISVWNADNRNDEIRFRIGEKLKEILELEPSTLIEYKHHSSSIKDMSSFRNAKGYVFTTDTAVSTTANTTNSTNEK